MNNLQRCCSEVVTLKDYKKISIAIYSMCSTITPQFYKNKSDIELESELQAILYLIKGIRQDVLAKMCELAINTYPTARAKNNKTFFDINYILTFYDTAWDMSKPVGYNIYLGGGKWTSCDYVDVINGIDDNCPYWVDDRLDY